MNERHRATLASSEDFFSATAVHVETISTAGPAGIGHFDPDLVEEVEPLEIPDLSFEFESLLAYGPNVWNTPLRLDKRGILLSLLFVINIIHISRMLTCGCRSPERLRGTGA
jgi:hypothetical protein